MSDDDTDGDFAPLMVDNNGWAYLPTTTTSGTNVVLGSGTGIITTTYDWNVVSSLDGFLNKIGVEYISEEGKCSSCNKNSQLVLKYKLIGVDRVICRDCCVRLLDKLFGVKINPQTEEILYGGDK